MEVFRELILRGTEQQLELAVHRMDERAEGDWQRNREVEKDRAIFGKPMYCYVYSPADEEQTAALWFAYRGDTELYVANIVPRVKTELSRTEYNQTLEKFYDVVAASALEGTGVEVEFTAGAASLDQWLSPDGLRLLKMFSDLANRSTGAGHPLDHKRWLRFVIQSHLENAELDASTLSRWLHEEERWSEDMALRLAEKYEEARDLLRAYDRRKRDG